MMLFALTGMLIGIILGIRFTVLALVPATICALVIESYVGNWVMTE
jgi:hypothetical protein